MIGGGLSGLSVALHLARGGLDVVVFDADRPGEHASTRNFGAIGRTIRPKFTDLVKRGGVEFATRVYEEAKAWVEYTADHALFRYFRRRIVPVAVYSAVSEPLEPRLLEEIIPRARTVLETRRLYTALRPVVGEDRFLVVGQHLVNHRNEAVAAATLRRDLAPRYPRLASVRFSHVWRGRFAVTFDWLPHLGTHEGIHYLHGLVGAGVPACGYLGHKLAQRILSRPNRDTVFADRRYPQRFGYRGSTWFLPLVGRWYRALDRREAGLLH